MLIGYVLAIAGRATGFIIGFMIGKFIIKGVLIIRRKAWRMEKIKIHYLSEKVSPLKYIGGEKSNWIDLQAAEDVEMKAGDFRLIPLGVAMQLPYGYEGHMVPRSSTFKNFGIIQTNSFGVIDESYCGNNDEWKFPAYALRNTVIHAGDRICQFRIMKHQPRILFETVNALENESRGGFGSTGTS